MKLERDWKVLLIGGPSGVGKSSIANDLARYFKVNVIEVDDICRSIKAMTTKEIAPWVHYWSTGLNWLDVGVEGNVKWLINISKEIMPALKSIINNHLESCQPTIIEGDFIHPDLLAIFDPDQVKGFYINEANVNQIMDNYYSREGGQKQSYRSNISHAYGQWQVEKCRDLDISLIPSRPWDNSLERALKALKK